MSRVAEPYAFNNLMTHFTIKKYKIASYANVNFQRFAAQLFMDFAGFRLIV